MNGDFEDNKFADISGDEGGSKKRKKKPSKNLTATAEKLDDSNDEDHTDNEAKVRFTSEGLPIVHVMSTRMATFLGRWAKRKKNLNPIAIKRKKMKNKRRRDKTVTMMKNHKRKRNSRGRILRLYYPSAPESMQTIVSRSNPVSKPSGMLTAASFVSSGMVRSSRYLIQYVESTKIFQSTIVSIKQRFCTIVI